MEAIIKEKNPTIMEENPFFRMELDLIHFVQLIKDKKYEQAVFFAQENLIELAVDDHTTIQNKQKIKVGSYR